MRNINQSEHKSSVLDTSLTELAFIFFFILLLVAVWKINEQEQKKDELAQQILNEQARAENYEVISQLVEQIKAQTGTDSVDELFSELVKATTENSSMKSELEALKTQLEDQSAKLESYEQNLSEVLASEDKEVIAETLKTYAELKHKLDSVSEQGGDAAEALDNMLIQLNDLKGQNNNLRQQVVRLGNGLDHPPCWADSDTGAIEYVFDVVINEDNTVLYAGWPDNRAQQALSDPKISTVPGVYSSKEELWLKTRALFNESVKNKCRHFVRIYDHASTKDAFKNKLLAVENHFYKSLRASSYDTRAATESE